MQIFGKDGVFLLEKEGETIGRCVLRPTPSGAEILQLAIVPAWRRRGYGTYLLKEMLRRTGAYDPHTPHVHTAPWPENQAELAFWQRQGFVPEPLTGAAAPAGQGTGDAAPAPDAPGTPPARRLVRRRAPDFSAVRFSHEFLAGRLTAPALCVDATCGNGGDTEFLCRLCARSGAPGWQVVAMDLQLQAVESTRARLAAAGFAEPRLHAVCADHAHLLRYVAPGSADAVLFNFGWLPGAEHTVYSTAESSLPALEAALTALRPGGVLSAVLYSGKTIGSAEKQAVLAWLRALPLSEYTVLVCEFANWAETAPLPCFVLKKV